MMQPTPTPDKSAPLSLQPPTVPPSKTADPETEAPTDRKPSTIPAKTLSVFVLLSTVLTGSLINSVPQLNEVVNVDSVLNCSLPYATLDTFFAGEGGTLTWLWPMLLPVVFIFVRDWNLQLDREKLLALYHHATGQTMSFSSTEIIRHFIVSPDNAFPQKCNLTLAVDCQNYKSLMTNTSQLCRHSNLPAREIFDSLHSIPNVTAALMGSSTVFLLCNLQTARQAVSPFFELHPACRDYKFCSRRLLKFLCLVGYVATAYYCLWQTLGSKKNTVQELAMSYAYGVAVQLTVLKTQQTNVPLPL